jgi:hypothetical protein
MPTGYTRPVEIGEITELKDFAMTCARAFGALIMMRDDPDGAEIPERFEPNTGYHDTEIAKAMADLLRLEDMDLLERGEAYQAARAAAAKCHQESAEKDAAVRSRYEAMLEKVMAWEGAPEGLKDFMIQQLTESIRFDCRDRDPFTFLDEKPWHDSEMERAAWSVEYHTKAKREEIERVEGRNAWLKQLRESLSYTSASASARAQRLTLSFIKDH